MAGNFHGSQPLVFLAPTAHDPNFMGDAPPLQYVYAACIKYLAFPVTVFLFRCQSRRN